MGLFTRAIADMAARLEHRQFITSDPARRRAFYDVAAVVADSTGVEFGTACERVADAIPPNELDILLVRDGRVAVGCDALEAITNARPEVSE